MLNPKLLASDPLSIDLENENIGILKSKKALTVNENEKVDLLSNNKKN